MQNYLSFDPKPRRPTKPPPAKSCDSQFHVLGPLEKYPVRAGAAYQMPTATWEAALRVHKTLGIERGVVVANDDLWRRPRGGARCTRGHGP